MNFRETAELPNLDLIFSSRASRGRMAIVKQLVESFADELVHPDAPGKPLWHESVSSPEKNLSYMQFHLSSCNVT
jgi:hypothetical protein